MTIPLDKLVPWRCYRGYCRNSRYAMWDPMQQHFVYVRAKFGMIDLDMVRHIDDHKRHVVIDGFRPEEEAFEEDAERSFGGQALWAFRHYHRNSLDVVGPFNDICDSWKRPPAAHDVELVELLAEETALREKLADILTRVAAALHGPPGPTEMHGWSDLPELAAATKQRAEKAEAQLPKWIPCSERMPEDRQTVLVLLGQGGVYQSTRRLLPEPHFDGPSRYWDNSPSAIRYWTPLVFAKPVPQ